MGEVPQMVVYPFKLVEKSRAFQPIALFSIVISCCWEKDQ